MIRLYKILDVSFLNSHPDLFKIWPKEHSSIVREVLEEHLTSMSHTDIGGIYAIMHEDKAIGITGYFPFKANFKEVGLRWHGILNEYRGLGYSNDSLRLMMEQALEAHPNIETLVELLPLTDEGFTNRSYFESLGFEPRGEPEIFAWADHPWQEMAVDVSKLMKILGLKNKHNPTI